MEVGIRRKRHGKGDEMKKLAVITLAAAVLCGAAYLGHRQYGAWAEKRDAAWLEEMQRKWNTGDEDAEFAVAEYYAKKTGEWSVQALCELSKRKYGKAEKKLAELKKAWEKLAEKGDAKAIGTLGWYYFYPQSPDRDEPKGLEYMERAAAMGNVQACSYLADIYRGNSVYSYLLTDDARQRTPPDLKKSFEYLKKAAELGSKYDLKKLGEYYMKGIGTEKNIGLAAECYEKLIRSEPAFKDRSSIESDMLNKLEIAMGFARGDLGEDKKRIGTEYIEKLQKRLAEEDWDERSYMVKSAYAICQILYADGMLVEKDQKKAEAVFDKFKDKNALARRIMKIYGESYYIGGFKPLSTANPATAQKWSDYLVKNGDPQTIFENEFKRLFGNERQPYLENILAYYKGRDLTDKLDRLIPLAEAREAAGSKTRPDPNQNTYGDLFAMYVFTGKYEKARKWLEDNFKISPWDKAYMAAGIYVMSKETPLFENDPQKAEAYYADIMKKRGADFWTNVGKIYSGGSVFLRGENPAKAEEYFLKAMKLGSNEARANLTDLLRRDPRRLTEIFGDDAGSSAESFTYRAAFEMGVAKFREEKFGEALEFFERAADTGFTEASGIVFYMYSKGVGTDPDPKKAAEWEERIMNLPEYQRGWAIIYLVGGTSRANIPIDKNYAEIFRIGEKAVALGSTNAAPELGDAYTESNLPNKYKLAEKLWLKTAEQEKDLTYGRLANLYGKDGPEEMRDAKKALRYRKAAFEQDMKYDPERIRENDYELMIDSYLAAKDEAGALEFAKKNAESSVLLAIYLSQKYRSGDGLPKDEKLADEYEAKAFSAKPEKLRDLSYQLRPGWITFLKRDIRKARKAAEAAYEKGGDEYAETFATMLFDGQGGPKDEKRAVEIMEKAALNYPEIYGRLYRIYKYEKNPQKAFECAKKYAEHRPWNSTDILRVAKLYHDGEGVPKDDAKAFEWAEKAYKANSFNGCLYAAETCAYFLENGIGTAKDPERAAKLRRWIEGQSGKDISCIGDMYSPQEKGMAPVPSDPARAARWYRRALALGAGDKKEISQKLKKLEDAYPEAREPDPNAGKIEALTGLGLSLCYGVGTDMDIKTGIETLKKAAELGGAEACLNLYRFHPKTGEADRAEAKKYLKKAAELGSAEANCMLAYELILGDPPLQNRWHFDKRVPKEKYEAAYALFEKAAGLGAEAAYQELSNALNIPSADFRFGEEYYENVHADLNAKYCDPERCFKFAAERVEKIGSAFSNLNLGMYYFRGIHVKRDYEKAYGLFSKAARMGLAPAYAYLAHMNAEGLGVPKNEGEAQRLYAEMDKKAPASDAAEIALLYSSPSSGLPPDKKKAEYWRGEASKRRP